MSDKERTVDPFESELIGSLEGDFPVVERVITQETAKTFNLKSVLAVLDMPGYDFSKTELFTAGPPVAVFDDTGRRIGSASVAIEGRKLVADLYLDYACPERLAVENGDALYARSVGYYVSPPDLDTFVNDSWDFLDFAPFRMTQVDEIIVDAIIVLPNKPRDTRIDPLGKPVT